MLNKNQYFTELCVYKNNLNEMVAHSVVSTNPIRFKGMNNKVIDSDKMIEIVGVIYGTFYNWGGEDVEITDVVLAKGY